MPTSANKAIRELAAFEATILKAGALQKAIVNSANFSSIATDEKGVIQLFNVGAEHMLGYAAAEVVDKITPADISDPQEMIARASTLSLELDTTIAPGFEALVFKASRGIEDIYELTYIRKNGSRFPAVVSVTALRDAQEKIIGYLLIGTDNTARKQAEEALLKAGALQKAIVNSANFSSIATDEKGVIQLFNVGAEHMLGYAASEVVDKITPADISDPQEVIARASALSLELDTAIAPGFEALVFKASRGIEDIYELTYIRKNGSRFPAVVSVTALRDAQEKIIGYLLIGTDNTARKQAEEALLKAGARLALATNALHAGIWDWDIRTNVIEWDERMCAIYGIPKNTQVDYQYWTTLVVSQDLPEAVAVMQEVIALKSQGSAEYRIKLPNGAVRYIQAAQGVILDGAGQVVRVIGVNIDTTDRKFNEDLERQVGERTAQLKAVNKELEAFAYAASHDLKAPLRVIDNASKWLEEDLQEHLTQETRGNMNLLRGRVRRMDKLLDDLLEYARIGRATDDRYSEAIAGDVLVDDVLALLAPKDFKLTISPLFARIQLHRMPLQQILMNLIGNAIKHHNKKAGCIHVTVEDNGADYAFAVQDDGPGIPAQFHEQIFNMFQTLRPRDQVEGSGMGLAMVRKSIEVFGGKLQLESAEGHGSTFRFSWPKRQQLRRDAA